jgi:predicted dithiol-disulfide oxidoreductase (DUF899 family)
MTGTEQSMTLSKIVSKDEWLVARKALLANEKAFSKARDALSAARRALPRVKVDKPYAFEGPSGRRTLAELFGAKRQLIVYHFMFDPSWDEGCRSCSLIADHFEGALPHLAARDVAFAAISRAPLAKIMAFQRRMGWQFPWLSSFETDFNYDYGASFRDTDQAAIAAYNFGTGNFRGRFFGSNAEAPGLSVFLRDAGGVFHTYSTYSRGLDILIGAYNYLDLTPLGRQEADLKYGMQWVRHHDRYDGAR